MDHDMGFSSEVGLLATARSSRGRIILRYDKQDVKLLKLLLTALGKFQRFLVSAN
jgi:hypothetical protein